MKAWRVSRYQELGSGSTVRSRGRPLKGEWDARADLCVRARQGGSVRAKRIVLVAAHALIYTRKTWP